MWLWSDHGRGFRAAVTLLALIGLGAYYAYLTMGLDVGWRQCVADPENRNGDTLVFPLWVVTGIEGEQRFLISKVVKDVPIEGPTAELRVGNTVSLIGSFDKDKMVVEQELIEIHHLRPYKEGIGAAGLLAALILGPLCFRWKNRRLTERGGG
jgi:hypothetical protein